MKRNKGFSLIELLVSLLVVSVALLGFAALQAYSTRTIRTTEFKNVGNEITQSFVKYLQMSQDSVRRINWSNGNTVNFSCDDGPDNAANVLGQRLSFGLTDLCSTIANGITGIDGDDLSLQFVRQTPGEGLGNEFAFFRVNVRYAYRPLRAQRAQQQNAGAAEIDAQFITVARYCPFGADPVDFADARITDNVVCDIVEVGL